jgi:tetratricopeptide (TPR) repeat protein
LAAGLALAGAALWRWHKGDRFYFLCFLWVVAACLPALAVVVRDVASATVAERYLYLPSVGLALAAGGIASAVSVSPPGRWRRAAAVLFAALLAAYAAASFQGALVWRSDRALWTHVTSQEGPSGHALAWANLGRAMMGEGDLDAAERFYARASDPTLTANPGLRANAVNGLGLVLYRRADIANGQNRPQEALRLLAEADGYFSAAAMTDPTMWGYWRNLAATRLLRVEIGANVTGRADRALLERARRDIADGLRAMPGNVELLRLRDDHAALSARLRDRP